MRSNTMKIRLTDAEEGVIIAAAEITAPTAKGGNAARFAREAALARAKRVLSDDQEESSDLLEALQAFGARWALAAEEAGDEDPGLNWYDDCAANHYQHCEPLTQALAQSGEPECYDANGRRLKWKSEGWEVVGDIEDRFEDWLASSAREAETMPATAEVLTKVGELIYSLEGLSEDGPAESLKLLLGALMEELGEESDEEIQPADMAAICWDENHVVHAEGWRFSVEERDDLDGEE